MKSIGELLNTPTVEKGISHERAAAVKEILNFVGDEKRYSFAAWLGMIGKRSYGDVLALIKAAEQARPRNKGAYLVALLTKKKK